MNSRATFFRRNNMPTSRYISLFATVLLALSTSLVFGGEKAFTSTGEIVILDSDGTWRYENQSRTSQAHKSIKTNAKKFNKPANASFPVRSKVNSLGLWMNPTDWGFTQKGAINAEAEYELKHKELEIYAMAITESIEVNLDNLAQLALENFEKVGTNVKVINKEYRIVNGQKVIFMEMSGVVNGIKATYMGYYHSNSKGASQLLAFTGTSLASKYKPEIIKLLNGLVVL